MADSQVTLHRIDERRLEKLPAVQLGWETCETCKRDMEELREGVWYRMDDHRRFLMDGDPLSTPDGHLVCSQRCLSQYVYEHVSAEDQKELCNIAQLLQAYSEIFSPSFDTWCLKHQALRGLFSASMLRSLHSDMQELSEAIDLDNEPAWTLEAAK